MGAFLFADVLDVQTRGGAVGKEESILGKTEGQLGILNLLTVSSSVTTVLCRIFRANEAKSSLGLRALMTGLPRLTLMHDWQPIRWSY